MITSALLAAAGSDDLQKRLLPGLADGSVIGAAALGGEVRHANGAATGKAGVVISGHLADVLLVPAGDDVLVIEKSAGGVQAEVPANLDQSGAQPGSGSTRRRRRCSPGARGLLTDVARAVLAAEAGPASPPRPPSRRRSTRRSASSSAVPSRPSRRSSTIARTCWWRPSWRRPPHGSWPGRNRRR